MARRTAARDRCLRDVLFMSQMIFADGLSCLGTVSAFTVLARAQALAAQGRDIINLGIGQPNFPHLSVDRVVKRYALLRRRHPELRGMVFHSTRKWFITQCERTGVPEHFTASLVGHHSARSANKLTYGLYSAGISDAQKREIVEGVRVPAELAL